MYILEKKYLFFVYTILYKFFLDLLCEYILTNIPGVTYGTSIDFSYIKYWESWGLSLLFLAITPHIISKVSVFFWNILFFICVIPLLTIYAYGNHNRLFLYLYLFSSLIIYAFMCSKIKFISPKIKNGGQLSIYIPIILIGIVLLWCVSRGYQYINFDFSKIYKQRAITSSILYWNLFGYLIPWTTSISIPFLIIHFINKKKYHLVLFFLCTQIILFSILNHKSTFFTPLMVLIVYYFIKTNNKSIFLPLSLLIITIISFVLSTIFDYDYLSILIIRRILLVPASLSFAYYDFFSQNEFMLWSSSILKYYLNYPYDLDTAHLIGRSLGLPLMNANNGFISCGYMHAGIFGMIIYSIIVGIMLKILDGFMYAGAQKSFIIALFLSPCLSLFTSGDLPTSMLTTGLLYAFFLFLLYANSFKQSTKL